MPWNSLETSKGLTAQNPSLVIAYSNLLRKLDISYEPDVLDKLLTQDDTLVDWLTATVYIGDIELSELYENDTWPNTSEAIVRFRRLDEATAGVVDHYCVVADHATQSIIDSLDGVIKQGSVYGTPTGWASYLKAPTLEELDAIALAQSKSHPERKYVLQKNETIWSAARKLNINVSELIEHNGIEKPNEVGEGYALHLPVALNKKSDEETIKIEVLDAPLTMHVIRLGGATKYSFGNVRKWKDITPSGPTYPENTNVNIVAIAHVPIEEDGAEAIYYMEQAALGDYAVTGRVKFTIGFNHSHLGDGHVERIKRAPRAQIKATISKARLDEIAAAAALENDPEPEPVTAPEPAPEPLIGKTMKVPQMDVTTTKLPDIKPVRGPSAYKTTMKPISSDGEPITFLADEDIIVYEMDGRRPARRMPKHAGVEISHTFEKNGVTFGLPASHRETGYWFGIPMDKISHEDEMFNYGVPLAERVAVKRGTLTTKERYWSVPFSRTVHQYTRLKTFLSDKNKNKKE